VYRHALWRYTSFKLVSSAKRRNRVGDESIHGRADNKARSGGVDGVVDLVAKPLLKADIKTAFALPLLLQPYGRIKTWQIFLRSNSNCHPAGLDNLRSRSRRRRHPHQTTTARQQVDDQVQGEHDEYRQYQIEHTIIYPIRQIGKINEGQYPPSKNIHGGVQRHTGFHSAGSIGEPPSR